MTDFLKRTPSVYTKPRRTDSMHYLWKTQAALENMLDIIIPEWSCAALIIEKNAFLI